MGVQRRDHGVCCFLFPLKPAVGLINMYIFVASIVNILALFAGDIRFQGNGYNLDFYRLPSIVGAFGLMFGFIGLLGVYDDKPGMVRAFNYYFYLKILVTLITMVADYWTLRGCDTWLGSEGFKAGENIQLTRLAELGVCSYARTAYIVGCAIDIVINIYMAYCCYAFQKHLDLNIPYPIDFSVDDKHSMEGRWRRFNVNDPRNNPLESKLVQDTEEGSGLYGSMDAALQGASEMELRDSAQEMNEAGPQFAPDGSPLYGPDGQLFERFASDEATLHGRQQRFNQEEINSPQNLVNMR